METLTLIQERNIISDDKNIIDISSNWQVIGSKNLQDTITTCSVKNSTTSMTLDDIVDPTTCFELKPDNNDTCQLNIKLNNQQRICKMGIVSEATVLEIFKEFEEYDQTVYTEFIDEYEGQSVNFAEITFKRPTPQAMIKFTRINNNNRSTMFLYGVRLALDEAPQKSPEQFDVNLISDFFRITRSKKDENKKPTSSMANNSTNRNNMMESLMSLMTPNNLNSNSSPGNHEDDKKAVSFEKLIELKVDNKLREIEERLSKKIDEVEMRTNEKLDKIIQLLETKKS
ncbi:hypothetical protein HCN44_010554 [Aphidius gifuensis]|uniref:Uncharacterized protein n=2 Tax=Aphidius gifuensis TaxID=684658 RepID=A0A834XQU7_APHGI|nr:hypothetical protein HCN44_010554 [Aphidius gifuensis]